MSNVKFHWIVFHYDFKKLHEMRDDFKDHNHEITFDYTCASIKTFLQHNPEQFQNVNFWTDDPELLSKKLKTYKIEVPPNIHDIASEIDEDKKHGYPWKAKSAFLERHFKDDAFFIDNDCICKRNLKPLIEKMDDSSIILWEFEKRIFDTRPYWGWQMATEYLKRPFSYWVANDGIIGLTKKNLDRGIMQNSAIICEDIYSNVDVSTKFPNRHPKVMISQQMAMCYAAQDMGLQLIESKDYFDHYYSNKKKCLEFL